MKSIVSAFILVKALNDLIGTADSFTACNNPSSPFASSCFGVPRPSPAGGSSSPFLSGSRDVRALDGERLFSRGPLRMAKGGEPKASSGDTPTTTARKQRRKRKEPAVVDAASSIGAEQESAVSGPVAPAQPGGEGSAVVSGSGSSSISSPPQTPVVVRSSKAVQLEVVDVRDAVVGRTTSTASSPLRQERRRAPSPSSAMSSAGASGSSQSAQTRSGTAGNDDDAFARLLKDAQQMRQAQSGDDEVDGASSSAGFSVPNAAKNAISTLITADFFLICAFLVWFLVGIFASSVLKDDAIQIAFNNIFQPVVQPALGVLMIGSIASAVFKGDDEDSG